MMRDWVCFEGLLLGNVVCNVFCVMRDWVCDEGVGMS